MPPIFLCIFDHQRKIVKDRAIMKFSAVYAAIKFPLINPPEKTEWNQIRDNNNTVNAPYGYDFISSWFHANDQYDGDIKMEVTEQKDEPYAAEWKVPPGIFPDQMSAYIQEAFNEYTEGWISDSPEPSVREPHDFIFLMAREGIVVYDSRNGEHEHDFYVRAYRDS